MDPIYATGGVQNKLGVLQPNGHFSYIGQDITCLSELPSSINGHLVKRLDLSFNLLTNLDGLERFDNLEELIIDSNQLGDDINFPLLHRLHTLTLNKNNIISLNTLLDEVDQKCPMLTYLSLLGNEACPNELSDPDKTERDYERFRYRVIARLPRLRFLDATPVREAEVRRARQYEAELQRGIVRPVIPRVGDGISVSDRPTSSPGTRNVSNNSLSGPRSVDSRPIYNPLPSDTQPRQRLGQKTQFQKAKYVYYGKHSEGNRFIRNNDL